MRAFQRLEPVECIDCYGEGIVERFAGSGGNDYSGYYPIYKESTCECCQGEGIVWTPIHTNDDLEALYWNLDCHDNYSFERMAA